MMLQPEKGKMMGAKAHFIEQQGLKEGERMIRKIKSSTKWLLHGALTEVF